MNEISYIEFYFGNPFLVFIFCIFILVILWFVNHVINDDIVEEAIIWFFAISVVVTFLSFLLSYAYFSGERYIAGKIPEINKTISNTMLVITLTILIVFTARIFLVKLFNRVKDNKKTKFQIERLKRKHLRLQNIVYSLGSTYTGTTKNELFQLEFMCEELSSEIDLISFIKSKKIDRRIEIIDEKLNDFMQRIEDVSHKEEVVHSYLNQINSKIISNINSKSEKEHFDYLNMFAALDFIKAYHYIESNRL